MLLGRGAEALRALRGGARGRPRRRRRAEEGRILNTLGAALGMVGRYHEGIARLRGAGGSPRRSATWRS